MPFVTEALWGTIPRAEDDPDLLVVARWPQAGPRDEALEAHLEAVTGLVTGIRNARAEAGIDVSARLAATIVVAEPLGATVAALRPAIERLARVASEVRPDDVTDGERPGTLTVLGRGITAVLTPERDPDALARERGRLEKDLADAERLLAAARARLADAAFLERAPATIVEGARAREAELTERVEQLRARLT
jgi:valyl-tRNA synthetase